MNKLIFFAVALLYSNFLAATEAVTWAGKPIPIALNTGEERLIRLPDNAMFRFPEELRSLLSVSSAAGILYITARDDLSNVPLEVKLASSGEILLFRLNSSSASQPLEEMLVATNAINTPHDTKQAQPELPVSPIELIKFAATRNLMPSRLWKSNPRIQESGIPNVSLRQLFGGSSSEQINAQILSIYRAGDLNLNVIKISNNTPYEKNIVFTDLTIDFEFASIPQSYMRLGPKGHFTDESILYLITKEDITSAMLAVDPLAVFVGDTI